MEDCYILGDVINYKTWDHNYSVLQGETQPNEASPESMERFDEIICDFMQEQCVPGAALCISLHGKPVYRQGYGKFGCGQPVLSSSHFRTASISKVLTAIGVMKLIEDGKLHLRARVFGPAGILSEYQVGCKHVKKLSTATYLRITVCDLLQHSAGWDRDEVTGDQVFWYQQEKYKGKINPWNSQQMLEYVLKRKLSFKPGERHAYSNFGYLVLGLVIERITGMPYHDYIQSLMRELGVEDINIGFTKKIPSFYSEVDYYNKWEPALLDSVFSSEGQVVPQYGSFTMENTGAYGGWVACAADLITIMDSLVMENGDVEHILSADTLQMMLKRPGYEKGDAWYGLGLDVSDEGSCFGHTGNMEGTSSTLFHMNNGLTWALLMNAWAKDTDYDGLIKYALSTVTNLLMWQDLTLTTYDNEEFLVVSKDCCQCVRILLPHSQLIPHVARMKPLGYTISHISALSCSSDVFFNVVWTKPLEPQPEWLIYTNVGVENFDEFISSMHESGLYAALLESYILEGEMFHVFILERCKKTEQKVYCVEDKDLHRKIFCTYFLTGFTLKCQCIMEYKDKTLISAIYDKANDVKSQKIWLDITVDNFVYLLNQFYMKQFTLDYLQFYNTKTESKVSGVWSSKQVNQPCFQRHDVSKYGFLYELSESMRKNMTVKFVSSYEYEGVVYFNAIWDKLARTDFCNGNTQEELQTNAVPVAMIHTSQPV